MTEINPKVEPHKLTPEKKPLEQLPSSNNKPVTKVVKEPETKEPVIL